MNAIVAVDEKWGIGKDGALLCHLPGDLKYFKEKTLGKICIMGRKTLESFPGGRPLPGRRNLVISASAFERPEEERMKLSPEQEERGTRLEFYESVEALTSFLRRLEPSELENYFVCGGASIYEQLLPLCRRVYVTKIEGSFDADRFFPDLDEHRDFKLISESERHEENGIGYRFSVYERTKPGEEE